MTEGLESLVPTNNSMRSQKGSPGNKRAGAERQDWAKESRLLGEDTSRLGLTDESLPRNVSLTNVTNLRWSLGCSSLVPMMQPVPTNNSIGSQKPSASSEEKVRNNFGWYLTVAFGFNNLGGCHSQVT